MSLLADILLISSLALFTLGVLSIFIKSIRIKQKLRYYFYLSILVFGLGLTFGWSDFKKGFNDCGINGSASVQVENSQDLATDLRITTD